MKRILLAALAALMLGLPVATVACSAAAPSRAPEASAPAPAAPPAQPSTGSADRSADSRMLIRTASVSLVVDDVEEVLSRAARMAQEMGGYVASSQVRDSDGGRRGQVVLRVPSDRLEEAISSLKGMATRVVSASTKDQDVTEEFVDQDARLRTLRATESQYLQLMKGATTTEDILKIQQALGQVREQIERTEGRMQYLRRSSEMAAITVELTTAASMARSVQPGWNGLEVFYEALDGLVSAATLLAGLAIWIVVFAPLWVPAWLLIRWWRRRPRRATPPTPPATPAGAS